ncbi:MAG: FKBP-type peptidyl-prolyl cis-trans isomerase [Maricaulaceae bacterium]
MATLSRLWLTSALAMALGACGAPDAGTQADAVEGDGKLRTDADGNVIATERNVFRGKGVTALGNASTIENIQDLSAASLEELIGDLPEPPELADGYPILEQARAAIAAQDLETARTAMKEARKVFNRVNITRMRADQHLAVAKDPDANIEVFPGGPLNDLEAEARNFAENGASLREAGDEEAAKEQFAESQRRIMRIAWSVREYQRAMDAVASEFFTTESALFLAENAEAEGVTVSPTGLQYKVNVSGPEDGARPAPGDLVKVHYTGRLVDGRTFDTSRKTETSPPVEFQSDRLVPGFVEGLALMRPGDQYTLYIPAALAYGPRGVPNRIPGNAALVFDVELIEVTPKADGAALEEPAD